MFSIISPIMNSRAESEKTKVLSVEELRDLGQKIGLNPDSVYDLSVDEATQVRKYLNPLGNVVSSNKIFVNMGLVNWKDRYLRKLHTTALIGYLYRTLEEYEPEGELEKEKARYNHACKQPDADLDQLKKDHEARLILITSTVHGIIDQFLNRNFEYDPDRHIRGSHIENKNDPDRKEKFASIKEVCSLADKAEVVEGKLRPKPDATFNYLRSHLLATYQAAVEATETLKSALSVMLDPGLKSEDKQGILIKKYKTLLDLTTDMKKIAEPIATADTLNAWKVNPPAEAFHQFDRYLVNHYEQLRDVVQALYSEKSDFEYAVTLYDVHKTSEDASEYRVQHRDEFRTEVFAVESSAVNLIGPFKENRERVEFYNKNTEVLKLMTSQLEADHQLGKDFMQKKSHQAKKKNIEEAGPDAPGLNAYAKANNTIQELGGKKLLTREEQMELVEAKEKAAAIKQDYEVPDDCIQVDVLFPEVNANGVSELKKTHFFTQAEAPLHMQEGSQFISSYQPKRDEGVTMETGYTTKTIVSKRGKKMTIQVPVEKK